MAVTTESGIHIFINQSPFPGSCQDLDGDGFGSPGDPSCPSGAVDDCDDGNPMISPLASDGCDGVENNCDLRDGSNDDLDGYTTCTGDCDDARRSTHPGAQEFCNGFDEDCDGVVDVPGENGNDLAFDSAGTTLSWTASTVPSVTYNVYRGSWGAGPFSFAPACFASALTQSQVSATQSLPAPPRASSTSSPARIPAAKETWARTLSATRGPTAFPVPEGIRSLRDLLPVFGRLLEDHLHLVEGMIRPRVDEDRRVLRRYASEALRRAGEWIDDRMVRDFRDRH
ncbi:MAG TPA: putative metal-binding motif-containing protein [Candidatus Polarisedimenticolia bacterium]|nr:putative metal-binding motif-containing protein [Candidatus Polarisedimenticolia bacterium]